MTVFRDRDGNDISDWIKHRADLSGANLAFANLWGADLSRAKLFGVIGWGTVSGKGLGLDTARGVPD